MSTPKSPERPVIVIAAGGTGGHVFPGIAVADAMTKMADVRVVFFGTPRGIESRVVARHGYELELLAVSPLKGVGPARAALGAVVAGRETARALRRIRALKPAAALSIGGYAAGPVSLAAALTGVPVALLEPNSTVGLTNKLLAPLAKEAYVVWAATGEKLRGPKIQVFGVPLRKVFKPSPTRTGSTSARVLVMGGSQGAAALNERLPQALGALKREMPHLEVVHQTGKDRDAEVRAAYAREGIRDGSVTVTPFLDDVATELERADLVVARAGAVTVAELAAVGRASVLIPFPHAADDHQAKNAMALVDAGAAVCIRQAAADAVRLASEIGALLRDDTARTRMADRARAHGRPDAAHDVAKALLALAGIPLKRGSNGAGRTNGALHAGHAGNSTETEVN